MQGPQTLLAAADAVPAGGHARAPRRVPVAAPRRTGRSWTPTSTSWPTACARGGRPPASSPTGRSSSCERILAIPIEQAIVPAMAQVAGDADRERVRDVVREVVYPADRRLLEALQGLVLRGDPRAARARSRRRTARRSTGTRSGAGRRSTWSPRTSTRSASTSWPRSTTSDGRSRPSEGFGNDLHAYRRKLVDRPRQPGAHARGARRPRQRGHRAGGRGRPAGLRPPPAGGLRGPPGRGVQGEGRAVRVLLPAGGRRVAARHLLRQHLRPARAAPTPSSRRRRSTRRSRATTSRSASRWSTPASTCSGGSAPGPRAARTSRAGACTPSAWPTSSGCTGRPRSGSGCSTRRPGAPRG